MPSTNVPRDRTHLAVVGLSVFAVALRTAFFGARVARGEGASAVDGRVDDRYDRRTFSTRTTDTPFVYYVDESRPR